MNQLSKRRFYPGIEALKGLLILQVVLTHTLGDNNLRFLLYNYHMPLFLAISGFLINREKLINFSMRGLINKYNLRMLTPWLIAFIGYNLMIYHQEMVHLINNWPALIAKIVYPYYHLWFVPALLFMIIILWAVERFNVRPIWVISISLFITSAWFVYFRWRDTELMETSQFYFYLGDKRLIFYFFFFYLSYYLKHYREDLLQRISFEKLVLLIALIAIPLVFTNYMDNGSLRSWVYASTYISFNIAIVYFSLSYLIHIKVSSKVLSFSSRYSLPIYLYHYALAVPIGTIVASMFNLPDLLQSFLVTLVTCAILLPLIKVLSSIRFIDLYLFGNVERLNEARPQSTKDITIKRPIEAHY
ncbi:MAG: acyltransferase [Bacteroidota bacterium]